MLRGKSTNSPPLLIGPVYLHWNAKLETYKDFLHHVETYFLTTDNVRTGFVIVTDEEKALMRAVEDTLPSCKLILCHRHVRESFTRGLEKLKLNSKQKNTLTNEFFGDTGLLNAKNEADFNKRAINLIAKYKDIAGADTLLENTYTKLLKYVFKVQLNKTGKFLTNNASEAMNKVLKDETQYTPQTIPVLIEKITDVIKDQYLDIERALNGQGNFKLCPTVQHLQVNHVKWNELSENQRKKKFVNFLRYKSKSKQTITSKDDRLTVMVKPKLAKKPGQRKRARSAKTVSKKIKRS